MVLAAVPFPGIAPGALLTGLPTQAASNDITKTVATAEKMKLVAESAKVRAGRMKLFMANYVSSGFEIEQPVDERRGWADLQDKIYSEKLSSMGTRCRRDGSCKKSSCFAAVPLDVRKA